MYPTRSKYKQEVVAKMSDTQSDTGHSENTHQYPVIHHNTVEITRNPVVILENIDCFLPSGKETGNYSCVRCLQLFQSKERLRNHIANHELEDNSKRFMQTTRVRHACGLCDKTFAHRPYLSSHIAVVHRGEAKFSCTRCAKSFLHGASLKLHLQTHAGLRFACNLCPKSFSQKSVLRVHVRLHKGEKNECAMCGKCYTTCSSMRAHQLRHTGVRFPCEQCVKTFSSQQHLNRHVYTAHEGDRFVCTHCGKSYSDKDNLKRHLAAHDAGAAEAGPFACVECGRTCSTRSGLKRHAAAKHGDGAAERVRFACDRCETTPFLQKASLKRHLERVHYEQVAGKKQVLKLQMRDARKANGTKSVRNGAKMNEPNARNSKVTKSGPNGAEMNASNARLPKVTNSDPNGAQLEDPQKAKLKKAKVGFPCERCRKRFLCQPFLIRHLENNICLKNILKEISNRAGRGVKLRRRRESKKKTVLIKSGVKENKSKIVKRRARARQPKRNKENVFE